MVRTVALALAVLFIGWVAVAGAVYFGSTWLLWHRARRR